MRPGAYGWGQTITLCRRRPALGSARYDTYGNLNYVVTTQPLTGVALWPTSVTENDAGEFERTTSYYTAALPSDVAVNSIDYVLWNAMKFEVSGEASQYRSPHTGTSFQTITLRRVEG